MDWRDFSLECPNRRKRRRYRAYPAGTDWHEGAPVLQDSRFLPSRLGISYSISSDADGKSKLNVSWDPSGMTSLKEVVKATKDLQKYYEAVYKPHTDALAQGILTKLIEQKRKGGRPQWSLEMDQKAIECAGLKDDEDLSEIEIAEKHGFAIQKDIYGRLSASSTARRYIRRGRLLRKK
jgi:hypothetical protein